ncbi:MAG: hypothetical protein WEB00_06275 [Dehalococcoidia bacterium]
MISAYEILALDPAFVRLRRQEARRLWRRAPAANITPAEEQIVRRTYAPTRKAEIDPGLLERALWSGLV